MNDDPTAGSSPPPGAPRAPAPSPTAPQPRRRAQGDLTDGAEPGPKGRRAEQNRCRVAQRRAAQLRTLTRPHRRAALKNEAPPRETTPSQTWKVDWPKVAEAERALAMRATERDVETAATEMLGKPAQPKGARDHETPPVHAANVFGVLASRCAGHRDCPEAHEVIEGIASRTPTERQLRAIRVFIRASTPEEICQAWTAGEFRLSDLMEKIERSIDDEAVPLMSGIHQWMHAVEEPEE